MDEPNVTYAQDCINNNNMYINKKFKVGGGWGGKQFFAHLRLFRARVHLHVNICTCTSARGCALSLAVRSIAHLTCSGCYVSVYSNFIRFSLKLFQGKYLLFEKYSYFTTFCLLGFIVIFRRSVAFRICLAVFAQRDVVKLWRRDATLHIEIAILLLCSTVICESYTRIGSTNLKDNKLLSTKKGNGYFTLEGRFHKPVPFFHFS